MKKYNVEMRRDCNEIFDNWIGDYIESENKEEAVELAKQWLIDNGMSQEESEKIVFKVTEKTKEGKIMLKKMVVSLGIASLGIGTVASAANLEAGKNYYPDTAIVVSLNYESDLVTVKDANDQCWYFEGCEDWIIGDLASLIMDDMGTENYIYDDEIVSVRYSGYWDTKILDSVVDWESTDTGLLLHFDDGTGYYIEK